MSVKLTIAIPEWLDRIFAWPVMLYRKYKYGYAFRRIYLGEGEYTILDEVDYYKYGGLNWTLGGCKKNLYAVRGIKNKDGDYEIQRLHRVITNAPKNRVVDHQNGNGLNNRGDNLRIATKSQNKCNCRKRKNTSSRFIGVHFHKGRQMWAARIQHHKKEIWIGYFKIEIDAARAYDRAAIKYHEDFARLNFPIEDYADELQSANSK
ncbi:MAG: HNH endonuclease [Sedimentisphaerales bacterium]